MSIGIITKRVSQSFRYFQIYVNREIVTKIIIKIIQRFVRRFIVNFQRSRLREEIFFFPRENMILEYSKIPREGNFFVSVSQLRFTPLSERRSKNLMKSHARETGKPPTGPGR